MNSVNLVGRLARDPDLRYTPNGTAVCSFVLAVRNPFRLDDDGNPTADFINCVVWQKPAEMFAEGHRKGDQVAVSGRLQTRSYENKDGETVWVTEVNVENLHFIKPKDESNGNGNGNRNGNRNQNRNGNRSGNRNNGR